MIPYPLSISHLLCDYVLCWETSGIQIPTALVFAGTQDVTLGGIVLYLVFSGSLTIPLSFLQWPRLPGEQRAVCCYPQLTQEKVLCDSCPSQTKAVSNSRFSNHWTCDFWVSHLTSLSFAFSHLQSKAKTKHLIGFQLTWNICLIGHTTGLKSCLALGTQPTIHD